jgi:hypothetical protein
MRFAVPLSSCVPQFRDPPSNHEATEHASNLDKVSARLPAAPCGRPRPRPGRSGPRQQQARLRAARGAATRGGHDSRNDGWAGVLQTPAQHCRTKPRKSCPDSWDVVDVPNGSTSRNSIKPWKRATTWIKTTLDARTREWFAADDAAARAQGWQVTSLRYGLGRLYRDPRFDTLGSCPACRGCGTDSDERECACCDGAGRIVIKPGASHDR